MLSKKQRLNTQTASDGKTSNKQKKTISLAGLTMTYRKQTLQDKISSYIKAGVSVTPQAQSSIARMNVIKSNAHSKVATSLSILAYLSQKIR